MAEVRQLALFAGEPAEEPKPARRDPIPPPEGFKPDLKRGLAWCPYCGRAGEFAWDAETCYARCPECGVSAEDFYTKTHNGLWPEEPMKKFVEAVKKSGRAAASAPPVPEVPAPKAGARPAAEEETAATEPPWEEVWCPECGRVIRAAYRPARVRCQHCGSAVVLSGDGGPDWEPPQDAARCRRCGKLLEEAPKPGVAYFCWRCNIWSARPDDRKGEKEAEAANAALPERKARKGLLPGPVLSRARDLAAGECANYQAAGALGTKHYCAHEPAPEGSCVFFAKERKERRCRWFEEALLPLEPHLAKAYWKSYEEPPNAGAEESREEPQAAGGEAAPAAEGNGAAAGEADEATKDAGRETKRRGARKAAREAKRVLEEERKKREKVCARCGKTFTPQRRKEKSKYCSEECRREVEKKQTKEWRERKAGKTSF